jgi:hypothetical protein
MGREHGKSRLSFDPCDLTVTPSHGSRKGLAPQRWFTEPSNKELCRLVARGLAGLLLTFYDVKVCAEKT